MQARTQEEVNILVVDYDSCLATLNGTHPKLLSKPILEFAKKMDAFYGCTHRCYFLINTIILNATKRAKKQNYSKEVVKEEFTTYKITENFQQESKLECKAVSTLEDVLTKKCGIGFETIIKPFEKSGQKPTATFVKSPSRYSKSKNIQLNQIAEHAADAYPSVTKIKLHYLDDNIKLCNAALTAKNNKQWPKKVDIEVYHHKASDGAPITPIKQKKATPLQSLSVFATVKEGDPRVPAHFPSFTP